MKTSTIFVMRIACLSHGLAASSARWLIMLLLFRLVLLPAAESGTRFYTQPGGSVKIQGNCNIHQYEIHGKEVGGEIEFGAGSPTWLPQTVKLGRLPGGMELSIPVRSLQYGSGVAMDKALHSLLKSEANPRIHFRSRKLNLKVVPQVSGMPYGFEAHGELVVAGVTNQLSMPMEVLPLVDGKLKITGSTSVNLSDFGIEPPRIKAAGKDAADFYIAYGDELKVAIELYVEQGPAKKGKL